MNPNEGHKLRQPTQAAFLILSSNEFFSEPYYVCIHDEYCKLTSLDLGEIFILFHEEI